MRVSQAAGGTNLSQVPAGVFAMPAGLRMRYDLAGKRISDWVSGYAIYICDPREPMLNWFLPSPPMITVLLDAGPVEARFRNGRQAVPAAALWGPITHAYSLQSHGGISVGIGLTGAGWAALTDHVAAHCRDKVVPLDTVLDAAIVTALVRRLDVLDDDSSIAPTLDELLQPLFRRQLADHEGLVALDRLLVSDRASAVGDLAAMLDIGVPTLRRLGRSYFGMSPKSLLTRARFVRSFASWLLNGEQPSYEGIDPTYHDASHFLIDARRFLGTTPRRFVTWETTYLRASLRARLAVNGSAAHALHAAGTPRSFA